MPTTKDRTRAARVFPRDELRDRLTPALRKIAEEAELLRPEWEPLLDSQRVIGTVLLVEEMIPWCRIPPDQVVRKGGYSSVEEAVTDMIRNIEKIVNKSALSNEH